MYPASRSSRVRSAAGRCPAGRATCAAAQGDPGRSGRCHRGSGRVAPPRRVHFRELRSKRRGHRPPSRMIAGEIATANHHVRCARTARSLYPSGVIGSNRSPRRETVCRRDPRSSISWPWPRVSRGELAIRQPSRFAPVPILDPWIHRRPDQDNPSRSSCLRGAWHTARSQVHPPHAGDELLPECFFPRDPERVQRHIFSVTSCSVPP